MTNNPLQQYFRQPKVFVSLPSQGIYSKPGTFRGSVENMPVFGMTGMDEIMLKTPDALLTGESTVKVLQSCCPNIVNPWEVSNLDIDALLVAIKIATSGNIIDVVQPCKECSEANEYEIDVSKFLDHFAQCKFNPTVVIDSLTIKLHPLNYKQVTNFNLENFSLQKRLAQAFQIENEEEKQKVIASIYTDLGNMQTRILVESIEEVVTPSGAVTQKEFISEWLANSDKSVIDHLKAQIDSNNDAWKIPDSKVKCDSCGAENTLRIELDQSSFFGSA